MKAPSFSSRLRAIPAKSPTTLAHQAPASSIAAFLAVALLAVATAPSASAQTVTYAGAGAVNFGAANVCPSGKTVPAPCSQTATLTYNITASGALGTPQALTTGVPNLDYKLATGTTCSGVVAKGSTCKVNVTFAPTAPGSRYGAVEIVDSSGNVLATTYIYGSAIGPLIGFGPPATRALGGASIGPNNYSIAADAAGNIFLIGWQSSILYEVLAVDGSLPANPVVKQIGDISQYLPIYLTIDGAGNLFFTDRYSGSLIETLAAGGYVASKTVLGSSGSAVAVDGSGNLFAAQDNGVTEFLAADGYSTSKALGGGFAFNEPADLTLDGSGNLFLDEQYVADGEYTGLVLELTAADGYATVRTIHVSNSGHQQPSPIAVDPGGNLFVNFDGNIWEFFAVSGVLPPHPAALLYGSLSSVDGIALDGRGNLFASSNTLGAPQGGMYELQFSAPPSLDFAQTAIGQTSSDSPQSVQIQNQGNAAIDLTGISLDSSNWELVKGGGAPPDCAAGAALAASALCGINVSFEPKEAGPLTGAIAVTDNSFNAPGSQQSIALSGTAIASLPAPQIASLNSTYGAPYSVVILYGTNFGPTQGSSTVAFNGVPTPHYLWADTKIYVTVPPNAATGNLVVTVGGQTSNAVRFTVLPQPKLTGISPTTGPVGAVVTLSGANLLDYENKGTVTFNGKSLPILSQSSTALKVAIPAGAVTGDFHVLVNDTGINSPVFTVTQ